MKIILTMKSILNYLYNNLIDLIWTKKIRFSDGTELTSANSQSGVKLYDIKVLAQRIADKGWCSIGVPKTLDKSVVPTLYADILDKYNNVNSAFSTWTTSTNDNTTNLFYSLIELNNEFYIIKRDNKVYRSSTIDLSSLNEVVDMNSLFASEYPDDDNNITYRMLKGNNTIMLFGVNNENNLYIFVFDLSFNFVKSIKGLINAQELVSCFFCKDRFFISYQPNEIFTNPNLITVEDSQSVSSFNILYQNFLLASISYDKDTDNVWLAQGNAYIRFTNFKDFTNYTDYEVPPQNITPANSSLLFLDNKLYCVNGEYAYYSTNNGSSWIKINTTFVWKGSPYLTYNNGKFIIVYTGLSWDYGVYVYTTTDFITESWTLDYYDGSGCITMTGIYFTSSGVLLTDSDSWGSSSVPFDYANITKTVYSQKFDISGTVITIDYYLHNLSQTKIITDLTQYNDVQSIVNVLGYTDFWFLNLNDEKVYLPQDTLLWTYIFVGDNYDDLNINTGNPSRVLPQAENIINDNASITVLLEKNTNYKFTNANITDITISSCDSSPLETIIEFSTGANAPTLTDNSGLVWADGIPTLNANSSYTVVIFNKVAYYKEY